jgi:indolepyruvate ferredoxin oxidoreductase
VPDLVAYQGIRYAERYVYFVERVQAAESAVVSDRSELAEAVARSLYKLMAYKDEYEVARLHLDGFQQARLRHELGEDAKVWFMLHPPLLRALGLERKLKLGRWFVPVLRALRGMRCLRGMWLDPFGHTKMRRLERGLIAEYEGLVDEALGRLRPESYDLAVELGQLPDVIRGYEEIKLRSVTLFRKRAETLLRRL